MWRSSSSPRRSTSKSPSNALTATARGFPDVAKRRPGILWRFQMPLRDRRIIRHIPLIRRFPMRLVLATLLALTLAGCTVESHTETSVTTPDGSTVTTRTESVTRNGRTTTRKTETTTRAGQTTKVVYEKQGDEWVKVE